MPVYLGFALHISCYCLTAEHTWLPALPEQSSLKWIGIRVKLLWLNCRACIRVRRPASPEKSRLKWIGVQVKVEDNEDEDDDLFGLRRMARDVSCGPIEQIKARLGWMLTRVVVDEVRKSCPGIREENCSKSKVRTLVPGQEIPLLTTLEVTADMKRNLQRKTDFTIVSYSEWDTFWTGENDLIYLVWFYFYLLSYVPSNNRLYFGIIPKRILLLHLWYFLINLDKERDYRMTMLTAWTKWRI